MAKGHRILALDIGAGSIKLAEFISLRDGSVELVNFGVSSLGGEAASDTERHAIITATIKELMHDCQIKPGPVLLSVSGQSVFSRFVKLPPVDKDKVYQIIMYEAQQNVPFPINEVVWDYQLIGRGEGELDVMLAAIKADIIVGLTDAVDAAGLQTDLVDVAPMALYNAVRYNYSDHAGCTLVVDIGARSTDLIFMEQGRVFIRSVPVAGNAITQQIMREFELSHDDAEEMKKAHAFVSFGGAYEDPKSEVAGKVSKIVRNVMTRMHAEIDRSIKFYRTQQNGMQPSLVLLTGGSAMIPYLDTFLKEKLKVDVDFLNPFVNVPVDKGISSEHIGKHTHELSQVVGLALRNVLACPIEINLLPPKVVAEKDFRRRQPLLVVAAVGVALVVGMWALFFGKMAATTEHHQEQVQGRVSELEALELPLRNLEREIAGYQERLATLDRVVSQRSALPALLMEVQKVLPPDLWLADVTLQRAPAGSADQVRGGGGTVRGEPAISAGVITGLTVRGVGYIDRVQSSDYVSRFRDALRASESFSISTEFISLPTPAAGEYTREFTLSIVLEKPLNL
ncbi:MAG TPA: type IV pilus assembly protein PilM [Kiritimatiellia bacterium]|nr:type IV pilus assembly protein PilM [Kiritimatiellia bacterium]HMP34905.1 type IV pilus assembly protein PilM [Kiritimatiellia bacterium]